MNIFASIMNIYSMRNKVQRQREIRKIIQQGDVRSQDDLLAELKSRGFKLTQATLSRDLKVLQVAKVSHPVRGYVYTIPEKGTEEQKPMAEQNQVNFLADGFTELLFSGNLAVMKTMPGYANSIAVVIDKASPWEILGTVAGDDTILIIQREGISKVDLAEALVRIMPKLEGKL